MDTHYQKKFNENLNCIMLTEWECLICDTHILTDKVGGTFNCPDCTNPMNALGSIVLNHGICKHNDVAHGHQHYPSL